MTSLAAGARLGVFEIAGSLGAGGMGEVYRAHDTQLGRAVALKILPESFAADPDRLMRFEREARTLASLNHPHIAQIHGVEQTAGVRALVMELVEGEDLSVRIARGPVPLDEALPIARQIADALEAAHEKGIIHRDLKPANIKVDDHGRVKVLDFGLAKALDGGSGPAGDPLNSPTITSPAAMTRMGVVLGTAAYMPPEQARGRATDRGADLWAFGAVLFEMLTGTRAFPGETVTDVLAAVVTRDPDWTALPPGTPDPIVRLLRRCLDRERRRRLSDAGEARFQIDEVLGAAAAAPSAPVARAAPRRELPGWLPWSLLALSGLAFAVLALQLPREQAAVARYSLETPPKAILSSVLRPSVAISPDGESVAFVATAGGVDRLFVRRMNAFDAVELPGTEGASNPVFSPDGQWIAFFAGGSRLVKVPVTGGAIVQLDDVTEMGTQVSDPRGLAWSAEGRIVFAPQPIGGLYSVPASGGARTVVTTPVRDVERTHRWPEVLPGGQAVLYTMGLFDSPDNYDNAKIEVVRLDTGETRTLATGAMARYVDGGYLLIVRGTTLYGVRFDAASLEMTGTPVPLLQDVGGDGTTGAAHLAVSRSGTLVYLHAAHSRANLRPGWMTTGGQFEPLPSMPVGTYSDPRISPDGQHLAVTMIVGGGRDIFVHSFARGTTARRTFGGQNLTPQWSRDGRTIYYSAAGAAGTTAVLHAMPSDGSSDPEPIVALNHRLYCTDVMPDGQLVCDATSPATSRLDILRIPPANGATPHPLVKTEHDEAMGRLSPTGEWIAYISNQSGAAEIYVRRTSVSGGRVQVSSGGGEEPKWSPDGKRLYYRSGSLLMSVAVDTTPAFEVSAPQQVLSNVYTLSVESGITYDVHPKNGRLLMIRPVDDTGAWGALRLITNWLREVDATLSR
ncbi:MAG TPA: protein kinase [Vicinamibacterales bacterium]|nr:protein kinase [Vicinamibacterales bacterium]